MRKLAGGGSAQGALPRRRFLELSVTTTAGALGLQSLTRRAEGYSVAAASNQWVRPDKGIIMIDRVSVSVFEACLGDTFHARAADGKVHTLELVEAVAAEPRPGLSSMGIREDPFALMFRAPAEAALGQGVYAVEHSRLGKFDLFLGPVRFRRPTDPIILQAVFG